VNAEVFERAMPWLTCLTASGGNKNMCLPKARGLVKDEGIVVAVLVCLAVRTGVRFFRSC